MSNSHSQIDRHSCFFLCIFFSVIVCIIVVLIILTNVVITGGSETSVPHANGQEVIQAIEGEESSQTKVTYNIVFVTSEAAPYSKTGGLGDVCGSLPIALAARGHRVMVVSPRYLNGSPSDKRFADALDVDCRIKLQCFGGAHEVSFFHEYRAGVDWVRIVQSFLMTSICIGCAITPTTAFCLGNISTVLKVQLQCSELPFMVPQTTEVCYIAGGVISHVFFFF